jgi:nucleoid DNA-binding protein
MNKNELAIKMVEDAGVTKGNALNVIDTMIEVISDELAKNDGKITLVGFGTFKTTVKKKKKGRNPKTGDVIEIPRRRSVKFVPGKKLKELVQ